MPRRDSVPWNPRSHRFANANRFRSIPARAGNTANWCSSRSGTTVHPRAGGEHPCIPPCTSTVVGPSPRGRGTHRLGVAPPPGHRSIPARAGNTAERPDVGRGPPVHPRAGGEHCRGGRRRHRPPGPSPRGRGTRGLLRQGRGADRSIPARAGNTPWMMVFIPHTPVHPRAGGEHQSSASMATCLSGPSPRGRGTPVSTPWSASWIRSIPARAGNTGTAAGYARRPSVHPRAGGEHRICTAPPATTTGPSPRGRGTPGIPQGGRQHGRSIPARAGNTSDPAALRSG